MERLAWPTGDESLFKVDPDSWDVACLNKFGNDSSGYASGYRLIVEWALERVLSEGRHLDLVVYPIIFNFRHHVELMLKQIIRDCIYVDTQGQKHEFPHGHDIEKLWRSTRAYVEKLFPGDAAHEAAALDAVEACLIELSKHDPRSTSFRYERERDGRRSLVGVSHIDLARVKTIVERVATFLDCTDTMASQAREWANERLAEMRD